MSFFYFLSFCLFISYQNIKLQTSTIQPIQCINSALLSASTRQKRPLKKVQKLLFKEKASYF